MVVAMVSNRGQGYTSDPFGANHSEGDDIWRVPCPSLSPNAYEHQTLVRPVGKDPDCHPVSGSFSFSKSCDLLSCSIGQIDFNGTLSLRGGDFHLHEETIPGIYKSWAFPGCSSPGQFCGHFLHEGCNNRVDHEVDLNGVDHHHSLYLHGFKRTCKSKFCRTCYVDWLSREAKNIEKRLTQAQKQMDYKKPQHVTFSPPSNIHELDYKKLRKELYRVLNLAGIVASSIIFHPYRQNKYHKPHQPVKPILRRGCWIKPYAWYFSPHFHIIGFGFVKWTDEKYHKSGRWVVKNIPSKQDRSIYKTAYYQLTHAGVEQKYHTVTYQGKMSYSSLKLPKLKKSTSNKCPWCGSPLKSASYLGYDRSKVIPVDPGGAYSLIHQDPEDWNFYSKNWLTKR